MQAAQIIRKDEIFKQLPPPYAHSLLAEIQSIVKTTKTTVVVLDDDPTGTQTVHQVPVLTEWKEQTLIQELQKDEPLFYILTNSRSMNAATARKTVKEICSRLDQAARQTGRKLLIVSRGDSTLRGHYPLEVEAVAEGLSCPHYITLLIPAFFEGGRYTINNVHYVQEGENLIPAGLTPFAQDATFGYSHSDLRDFVEEKTDGAIKAESVIALELEKLRNQGPDYVQSVLESCADNAVVIVNAADYQDLYVVTAGLLRVGRRIVLRTAASIVPPLAGMEVAPILQNQDFNYAGGGTNSLIIVGSHVPKSTLQLNYLLKNGQDISPVELDVQVVLDSDLRAVVNKYADQVNQLLEDGNDVVLFTSRKLISFEDKFASLAFSKKVSDTLTGVVAALRQQPKSIIAKGGITSSDIATDGLGVKRAMVKGPVLPGVPVWELGPESKFPGMNYVVFPGNVGGEEAVFEVYLKTKS